MTPKSPIMHGMPVRWDHIQVMAQSADFPGKIPTGDSDLRGTDHKEQEVGEDEDCRQSRTPGVRPELTDLTPIVFFKSRARASQRGLLRGLRSIVNRSLADRERGSVSGVLDGRRVRPGFETAKDNPSGGVRPEDRRPGRCERPFGSDHGHGSIGERFALRIDEFECHRLTRRRDLQDDRRRSVVRLEPQLDRLPESQIPSRAACTR